MYRTTGRNSGLYGEGPALWDERQKRYGGMRVYNKDFFGNTPLPKSCNDVCTKLNMTCASADFRSFVGSLNPKNGGTTGIPITPIPCSQTYAPDKIPARLLDKPLKGSPGLYEGDLIKRGGAENDRVRMYCVCKYNQPQQTQKPKQKYASVYDVAMASPNANIYKLMYPK